MTPSKRDIAVKQIHIDRGHQGSAEFCPVALAGAEAVPECRNCHVWREGFLEEGNLRGWIRFTFKNQVQRTFILPHEVTLDVVKFDTERKMVPFGFSVPLVIDFPVDQRKSDEPEPPEYKGSKK